MRPSKKPWLLLALAGGAIFFFSNPPHDQAHSRNISVVTMMSPAHVDSKSFAGEADAVAGHVFENGLGMKFTSMPELKVSFGIHEVTRKHFLRFANEVGLKSVRPASHRDKVGCWTDSKTRDGLVFGDDHPVVSVSWEEATYFCVWLSKKENLFYRLATDYEWSHANGLRSETAYYSPSKRALSSPNEYVWGGKWDDYKEIENFADYSYFKHTKIPNCFPFNDGFAGTAPVMKFPPNDLGIYDMGGNVSEWVYDWFRGQDELKTIRGASYRSSAAYPEVHKIGFRTMGVPGFRSEYVGFRVVVEHDERFLGSAATKAQFPVIPPPVINEMSAVPPIPAPPSSVGESRKKVKILYSGSDGINFREERNFNWASVRGAVVKQDITDIYQVGDEVADGDETWVKLEFTGWMPVSVGKSVFLKEEGDSWKVVWNRKNDRYVAMRSYPNSDSTLVAKINYGTVVEALESKTVSGRPYIHAKVSGWCVRENRKKTYIEEY